ncbi:hypothetical protein [Mycobacteroides abscessus]|uniref:hypothetical protein n=1 Tax=Mycobacteroides abscessus TaxID=36809 RepID=UPI001D1480B1|nr:hypothetical protein [Mycobacteroides abscessus]UEA26505.1 hypothetical protein LK464_11220 [Mycobacteroides abscessus subsp. abscessus]
MTEDRSVAQARVLLTSLYESVDELSLSIAKAEQRLRHTPCQVASARHQRKRVSALRKDLHEAHRLIDGLHRRFPASRDVVWSGASHQIAITCV